MAMMNATGLIVACSVALAVGVTLVTSGWRQPRPSLSIVARNLQRPPAESSPRGATSGESVLTEIGRHVLTGPGATRLEGWRSTTRLIGRPLELHLGLLVAAATAGFLLPTLAVGLAGIFGADIGSMTVPAVVSLGVALLIPILVHSTMTAKAEEVQLDLRHQLSAYFDMVTMLLAGNTGHEGALAQAAATGDGLLFEELRRRLREAGTTGQSHIRALEMVGDDYDIEELRQFAAAASLTAAEGAPVARTLAAKCATLRSTMAAEQEAKARVRNDKITPPLVGMALLFMVLIIYPALQLN